MIPYLWLKAVHVAAVLIFVGGLFAQSFAVATGTQRNAASIAFMSRWDNRVTAPAMLIVWLSGASLAVEGAWFAQGWLWAKLCLVLVLTGLHGVQSGKLRRLPNDDVDRLGRHVVSNVVIVASSVAFIALLVVAKPF